MADKAPHIGTLDRRIEIQQCAESRTASGSVTEAWSAVARCWAAVSYPNAGNSEDVMGDQLVATTRVDFTVRYRDGIDEKMRVLYQGKHHYILPPIKEVGRRAFLTIPTQKQV